MRWPQHVEPRRGMQRTRLGFLWIPRCVAGEWRWLEQAAWLEEVPFSFFGPYMFKPKEWLQWPPPYNGPDYSQPGM